MSIRLNIFSSTPDIVDHHFVVSVLTGTPEELLHRAVEYGYDGIEFLPDPYKIPDPVRLQDAMKNSGGSIPVLNTGRLAAQGVTLLHTDEKIRKKSITAFKSIIDVAGHIGANVGLGMSRGFPDPSRAEQLGDEVFRELAAHAEKAGATVMLEPADPGFVGNFITTVAEAVSWVKRINSPGFTVMLDTYQLTEIEKSLKQGIEDAEGRAHHIHFYDPSHWPPGVLDEALRLDWTYISTILKETNFSGTGSVVLAPEGDPKVTASKAAAFLRKFF
jgi:D-psicose/D-tagatose/L-ribulose 3-epimerase